MSLHAPADATSASLDPLIVNPGRLSILLALSNGTAGVEFVDLRQRTGLTDGNLASHARRLANGGLIDIAKQFRGGKPVTTYLLTQIGERSLKTHIACLVSAVAPAEDDPMPRHVSVSPADEDDWVD